MRPVCASGLAELNKANIKGELIIVDDNSNDGSVELVEGLRSAGFDVRILVRTSERGLSSAVLHGFADAKFDVLVCMDADLQHDPIYLPSLISPIAQDLADFCVGSRNIAGGRVEDWPLVRRAISLGATLLSRPLTTCTDPMSGFFCLRKTTLQRARKINATGFKIGLELMVRCRCTRIAETPIVFRDREAGESKLTMKQNVQYLRQLLSLYGDVYPLQLCLVVLVGLALVYMLYARLFASRSK